MDKNQKITDAVVKENIESKLLNYYGVTPDEATEEQIFASTLLSIKEALMIKKSVFHEAVKRAQPKKVYYM